MPAHPHTISGRSIPPYEFKLCTKLCWNPYCACCSTLGRGNEVLEMLINTAGQSLSQILHVHTGLCRHRGGFREG